MKKTVNPSILTTFTVRLLWFYLKRFFMFQEKHSYLFTQIHSVTPKLLLQINERLHKKDTLKFFVIFFIFSVIEEFTKKSKIERE